MEIAQKQLVFFMTYVCEAVIAYIYYSDNFDSKFRMLKSVLISAGLYLFAFLANLVSDNNMWANVAAFLLVTLIYSKISFEISFKSAVFHASLLTALMSLSEIIVEMIIGSVIATVPDNAYTNSLGTLISISVASKTLYLLLCKLISFLNLGRHRSGREISKTFPLFLYPIIVTVLVVLYFYASIAYNFSNTLNVLGSVISILSLAFCCFIFIYSQHIQKQEEDLAALRYETQKNEINKTFYELLEKKNEDRRVMVHDIKHHLGVVNSMDDADEIKSYLAKLQGKFDSYEYIGKSNNKMLDLILSKYAHVCKKNDISFSVDVRTSNLSFIEDTDLTSLLSNLLDNAVEAAVRGSDRQIRFTARRDKSFEMISVINTSPKAPVTRGERLISTKPDDATFHGCGVKSIEKTAKKYGGITDWSYDENDGVFRFSIIFNR